MNAPTIGITAFKAYKCGVDLFILGSNVFSINEITRTELPFIKYIIWLKRIHFKQAASLAFLFIQLCQRLHKADKLLLLQITWPTQGKRYENGNATRIHSRSWDVTMIYLFLSSNSPSVNISSILSCQGQKFS